MADAASGSAAGPSAPSLPPPATRAHSGPARSNLGRRISSALGRRFPVTLRANGPPGSPPTPPSAGRTSWRRSSSASPLPPFGSKRPSNSRSRPGRPQHLAGHLGTTSSGSMPRAGFNPWRTSGSIPIRRTFRLRRERAAPRGADLHGGDDHPGRSDIVTPSAGRCSRCPPSPCSGPVSSSPNRISNSCTTSEGIRTSSRSCSWSSPSRISSAGSGAAGRPHLLTFWVATTVTVLSHSLTAAVLAGTVLFILVALVLVRRLPRGFLVSRAGEVGAGSLRSGSARPTAGPPCSA